MRRGEIGRKIKAEWKNILLDKEKDKKKSSRMLLLDILLAMIVGSLLLLCKGLRNGKVKGLIERTAKPTFETSSSQMAIYTHTHTHTQYIYIYIWERERERERELFFLNQRKKKKKKHLYNKSTVFPASNKALKIYSSSYNPSITCFFFFKNFVKSSHHQKNIFQVKMREHLYTP